MLLALVLSALPYAQSGFAAGDAAWAAQAQRP